MSEENEDVLGHDPLEEGLDSIWNVPRKKPRIQQPEPQRENAPEQPAGGGESTPSLDTGSGWQPVDEETARLADQSDELSEGAGIFAQHSMETLDEEEAGLLREKTIQLVGFRVGDELFGIDIMKVQEIIRTKEITRVPRTSDYVMGVVNLRGKVIPVINLAEKFSMESDPQNLETRRVIIVNTDLGVIGFEVDEVTEVFRIPESIIVPPPPSSSKLDKEYITGVGRLEEQLLIILNLDQLVSSSQMVLDETE